MKHRFIEAYLKSIKQEPETQKLHKGYLLAVRKCLGYVRHKYPNLPDVHWFSKVETILERIELTTKPKPEGDGFLPETPLN